MTANPRHQARTRRLIFVVAVITVALVASNARALPKATSKQMPRDPNTTTRWAWEPSIAMGPDGAIWVAANRCIALDRDGLCSGTPDVSAAAPVWRSTDGGKTYRFLGDAMRLNADPSIARPGGASVDIAVAQLPRGGNPALVSVLTSTMSSSMLAISADNGGTWRVAVVPNVSMSDRPSIASSFGCDLFLATRAQETSLTRVERYDACQIYDGSQAIARPQSIALASGTTDPATRGISYTAGIVGARGNLYVASLVCVDPASQGCDEADDRETARVAISRNRGVSFTEIALPAATLRAPLDGTAAPIGISADDLGNVVVVAWDGAHIRLWRSKNDGVTWSLSRSPVDSAVRWQRAEAPTVAVRGNSLAIAWFGSPKTTASTRSWYTAVARSTDGGRTFTYTKLGTPLAKSPNAERLGERLRDGIGALVNRRGAVALAYSQSCDGHAASDSACPPAADAAVADLVIRYAWIP